MIHLFWLIEWVRHLYISVALPTNFLAGCDHILTHEWDKSACTLNSPSDTLIYEMIWEGKGVKSIELMGEKLFVVG